MMRVSSYLLSIVYLLSAVAELHAAQQTGPRTYQEKEIASETIADLMPKLPVEVLNACLQWIKKHECICKKMLAPSEPPSQFEVRQKTINKELADAGIKNVSRYNFVVEPTPGYFMHVAGPINRICNLLAHNNKRQDVDYTNEELDEAIKNRPNTYQTVSIAAHYLLCKQTIENEKLQYVRVPETHLIAQGTEAHDGNSYIVQRRVPDEVVPLNKMSTEKRAQIPLAAIQDMLVLARSAGLWDLTASNVLYNEKEQAFYVTDLEQPNNSDPVDFFHKNRQKYVGNARCGIGQFGDLFKGIPAATEVIHTFEEQDPVIRKN